MRTWSLRKVDSCGVCSAPVQPETWRMPGFMSTLCRPAQWSANADAADYSPVAAAVDRLTATTSDASARRPETYPGNAAAAGHNAVADRLIRPSPGTPLDWCA